MLVQILCRNQILGYNPVAEEFGRAISGSVAVVGGRAASADADVSEFMHQTKGLRSYEIGPVDKDHRRVFVNERETAKFLRG